ncbi:hypothetical protein, partial [Rubrivirga sp.]|uniref:hypothetical protein n=1 Tax=Rubrivirga sp. TaxID=1885344 RepID=UPI003C74EBF6
MLSCDTAILSTTELATLAGSDGVTNYRTTVDADGVVTRETASVDNLKVTVTSTRTRVHGSVSSYIYGSNFPGVDFDPADVGPALDDIAGRIGLPTSAVRDARVSQLDAAVDVVVPRPVPTYVAAVSGPPGFNTLAFSDSSVAFTNTLVKLAVYDKVAERRARRQTVPERYEGTNVVRFEVRFKRPARTLEHALRAEMMSEPTFYDEVAGHVMGRFE